MGRLRTASLALVVLSALAGCRPGVQNSPSPTTAPNTTAATQPKATASHLPAVEPAAVPAADRALVPVAETDKTAAPAPRPRYCHRERFAVCIGINGYLPEGGFAPLSYAGNDAVELAAELGGRCGFEHVLLMTDAEPAASLSARFQTQPQIAIDTDVSHRNLELRLAEFLAGATAEDDLVLLFFAGHGASPNEHQAFLAPVDFSQSARHKNIPIEAACHYLYRYPIAARKKLVLLDACRSGHSLGAGFATVLGNQDPQLIIMSSCDKEQSAYEDTALRHGRFTWALLAGIEEQYDAVKPLWLRDVLDFVAEEFDSKDWRKTQAPRLFAAGKFDNPRYFPLYFPLTSGESPAPDQLAAVLKEAREDYQAHRLEEALPKYASCIEAVDANPAMSLDLQLRSRTGEYLIGFQTDPPGEQEAPGIGIVRAEYARVLYRLGLLAEADKQLGIALKVEPKSSAIADVQGYQALDGGKFEQALAHFDQADEGQIDGQGKPFLASRQGYALRHLTRYAEAAKRFHDAATTAGDEDHELHYYRLAGESWLDAGQFDEALKTFELIRERLQRRKDASASKLRLADVHERVGQVLVKLDRNDDAAKEHGQATQLRGAIAIANAGAEPGVVVVGGSDEDLPPDLWIVYEAGSGKEIARGHERWGYAPLAPGRYRLAIRPDEFYALELPWREFEVPDNKTSYVTVSSGIRLKLPKEADDVYAWGVIAQTEGDEGAEPVQWLREVAAKSRSAQLPPGQYRLQLRPRWIHCQTITWPEPIVVEAGKFAEVNAQCGVALTLPDEVGDVYGWGLVAADEAAEPVQWLKEGDAALRTVVVPPGKYRLQIRPAWIHCQTVTWPDVIEVKPGTVSTVVADSGVRLALPMEENDSYGWGVVSADEEAASIQWFKEGDAATRIALLPPGKYRLQTRPTWLNCETITWPEPFEVTAGAFTPITIGSGVKLTTPKQMDEMYGWGLVTADQAAERVQWFQGGDAKFRTAIVPPGKYRLQIRPTWLNSQTVTWPDEIVVEPNKQSAVEATSGIVLELPLDANDLEAWRVVPVADVENVVQHLSGEDAKIRTILLPPGAYRVEIRGAKQDSWQTLAERAEVEMGKLTTVKP